MTGARTRADRARQWAGLGAVVLLVACALVLAPATQGRAPRAGAASPGSDGSYAIIDAAGGVMTFGGAGYAGDTLEIPLQQPVVGGTGNPGGGYWLVA
ncbi:MAG TPA: hypothetical protein VEG62_05180, partial [Acidimicrobiales bacterium]|nr:hypothetical protein [Acidimicrobiales bacterium]